MLGLIANMSNVLDLVGNFTPTNIEGSWSAGPYSGYSRADYGSDVILSSGVRVGPEPIKDQCELFFLFNQKLRFVIG